MKRLSIVGKDFHTEEHALGFGVEAVDHPTDGQLIAYAEKYFKRTDPMRPRDR
jgi:hypothetical protein